MPSHEDLIIQASRLYYEQNMTQAEIGRQLQTSRSTVSRLLQQARDSGIVRIIINYPWKQDDTLEAALCERFHLREAYVLRNMDRPWGEVLKGAGLLAARYLSGIVRNDMVLGVSYGRSVAATVQQLEHGRKVEMTVVQVLGSLGTGNPLTEGPDLVRQLANVYDATYRYLPAPMIVEDTHTRDLLVQEPYVNETLQMGRRSDAILLGIGTGEAEASGAIWTGYISRKERAFVKSRGGIGHMCAQYFDAAGQVLDIELNRRVISIGIEALRNIETVIAVATSKEKARAILGALRGKYIDVLVTDDLAAMEVLALDKATTVLSDVS